MNPGPTSLEQIVALLAAPPPRRVPPELRRAAMRQTAPMLFVLIGAGLTLFALMFVVAFFPWNLAQQWQLDADGAATASGKIVGVERTNISIGKKPVMRFTFEFMPATTGRVQRGTCYTTGSSWTDGASVTVRYRPNDPGLACVEGARLSKTGGAAAFVLLFPGIGVTAMVIGLRLRHRALHLLVHGEVAEAFVTALETTSTTINNHPLYRIMLRRVDRPDDPLLETRKWDPAVVSFARARLESKQPVFVLFDPRRPKGVLLPETL